THPVRPALTLGRATTVGRTLGLRVLGASHQGVLRGRDGDVDETVACLPGHRPYLPEAVERRVAGRRYRFRATVDQVSAAEVSARADERRARAERRATAPTVVASVPAAPDALPADGAGTGRGPRRRAEAP